MNRPGSSFKLSPAVPSTPTLVIVPTYQERNNLEELLPVFFAAEPGSHLLVVDDESGDGTGVWLRARPEFGSSLFLLERSGKRGLGKAYLDGFRWALARPYAYVCEMDADLSHDPGALALLRRAVEEGADVAIGSRYRDGVRVLNWPISRLLLSLGAAHYTRALTGMPLTDPTSGFKCFRRAVLESLDLSTLHSTGYSFQIEVNFRAWWAGFRLAEVPITFADRHVGVSKMSLRIAREAVVEVARLGLSRLFSRRKRLSSTAI